MPTDFLIPTGADLVNNGVWQQAPPLSQYIGAAVDDPNIVGDPPPHPPACNAGGYITSVSITGALYQLRHTPLPTGRASVNFIQGHMNGQQIAGAATVYRFRTNDGAGPTQDLLTATNANNAPPVCANPVLGGALNTNPDTGGPWLESQLRPPYARFSLDTNGAFLNQRLVGWAHLHADVNLAGGITTMETIGACWIPFILAKLGELVLLRSDWFAFHAWFLKEWGCNDPRRPAPSLVNREEQEWVIREVLKRPRFVYLRRAA